MRWLLPLLLTGCGGNALCSDAPLAGAASCTRLEGTWRLEASDERVRCGAETLANAMHISSKGFELRGTVAGAQLSGYHYVDDTFDLGSTDGRFSLKGQHHVGHGEPDTLSGSVVFGGAGQSCDALWDFTAHRE